MCSKQLKYLRFGIRFVYEEAAIGVKASLGRVQKCEMRGGWDYLRVPEGELLTTNIVHTEKAIMTVTIATTTSGCLKERLGGSQVRYMGSEEALKGISEAFSTNLRAVTQAI